MVHITTTTDPTEAKRIAKADDMAFALKDLREEFYKKRRDGEDNLISFITFDTILKSRNINLEDILR